MKITRITARRPGRGKVEASTPEAFGELLNREIPKWTQVVNDAGVKNRMIRR